MSFTSGFFYELETAPLVDFGLENSFAFVRPLNEIYKKENGVWVKKNFSGILTDTGSSSVIDSIFNYTSRRLTSSQNFTFAAAAIGKFFYVNIFNSSQLPVYVKTGAKEQTLPALCSWNRTFVGNNTTSPQEMSSSIVDNRLFSSSNLVFDGAIRAVVEYQRSLYVGGDFSSIGIRTPGIARLNSTNAVLTSLPDFKVFGQVLCSVAYNGVLYIGGNFTYVNDVACKNIAAIDLATNKVLTTFNSSSGFNSIVRCIAINTNGFFCGGDFTSYAGVTRQYIAKLDPNTAALDATFNSASGFNISVNALSVDATGLYCGGDFVTYAGTTRQRVARLNPFTAVLDTTFDSAVGFNGSVRALAINAAGLYCSGSFSTYKGIARQSVAKLNLSTAALDTLFDSAVGFDNAGRALSIDSTGLYVGGDFTAYKGIARQRVAKLNFSTAALDTTFASAVGFNTFVTTLSIDATGLYCGGAFISYGVTPRQRIAKLNLSTAVLDTTFDSAVGFNSNSIVNALSVDTTGLYCGGDFAAYKGIARQRVAKLNISAEGSLSLDTTFDSAAGFDSGVRSLSVDTTGLYVGGGFTSYAGTTRQRVAKLNFSTAALDTTFDSLVGFNGIINALSIDSTGLYVGGDFTAYKGIARQRVAKLNFSTAALDTTFDSLVGFNGIINALSIDSTDLYVGGDFTAYKGIARQRIAKLNLSTAVLDTTFDSAVGFNGSISAFSIDATGLYCGGVFTSYKGIARQRIAKLNLSTAVVDATFDSTIGFGNGELYSIAVNATGLYCGGFFTSHSGISTPRIAKLNPSTAALDTTFATTNGFNGDVFALVIDETGLFCGGNFTTYKFQYRINSENFSRISLINADPL